MRGGKHGADPQADQRGRLRAAAPFDLVSRVVLVVLFRGVCLAAAARKWGPQKSASVASSFLGQSFAALVYA